MLRAEKGERTDEGRGGRNGHAAQVFRGQEGRWGASQGRQGIKCRDGQLRLAVVEVFPGGQYIKHQNRRGRIVFKREVYLSTKLVDGGRGWLNNT